MDYEKEAVLEKLKELYESKELDGKRIFVFGCNRFVVYIDNFLDDKGYKICNILDNDKKKQNNRIADILVIAPEEADLEQDAVVLIASKYEKDMIEQLWRLSEEPKIFSLIGLNEIEKKEKFWLEENFEEEIQKIYQGAEIYEQLKQEELLLIMPLASIGDTFQMGLYFHAYEQTIQSKDIKVVVPSMGAYKVAQLFEMKEIVIISMKEIEALVRYIIFNDIGKEEAIIFGPAMELHYMGIYKKIPFPRFLARYSFRIGDRLKKHFPSIWDKQLTETKLSVQGLKKGKSIVLSPYTNTIEELPSQFWEILTDKLSTKGYCVFTNVVGNEKPVKGSMALEIPLEQIGSYLDFAGYFIALRSGLCEIAGRSECRKIVIYRDRKWLKWNSELEVFDLFSDNIAKNTVQYLYNDEELLGNMDRIIALLEA